MMQLHLVVLALLSLTVSYAQTAVPNRWEGQIAEYEKEDRAKPSSANVVLFSGASGIRLWKSLPQDFPGLTVLNRGFGGAQFSDMVHFADRVITNYKPRVIVLQGGANDLNAKKTPEQVVADFKTLTGKIRAALPDAKIVFLGINPSPARWEQREEQQTTNRLLKTHLGTLKNTVFLDMWDDLLDANGQPREALFVADKLHPSELEYKRRAALILPHIR